MSVIPSEPYIGDQVTYPDGPAGSTPISVYAADGLVDSYGNFLLSPDEEVSTHAVDLVSPSILDQSLAHELMRQITQAFTDNGEELLAQTIYSWQEYLVTIPSQVCVPNPFGDPWCFDVPGGGTEWGEVIHYRLWFLTRPRYYAAANARAMGAGALIVLFLGIIGTLITVVGIQQVMTGRLTFRDMVEEVRRVISAPGENGRPVVEEIKWSMIAVGVAMVVAAVAAPALMQGNIGARIGGGRVPGEVSFGIGSAPTRGRR